MERKVHCSNQISLTLKNIIMRKKLYSISDSSYFTFYYTIELNLSLQGETKIISCFSESKADLNRNYFLFSIQKSKEGIKFLPALGYGEEDGLLLHEMQSILEVMQNFDLYFNLLNQ